MDDANPLNPVRLLWLPAAIVVLYMAAVWFRPLMPIDETRYMSVAWEMFLRHGWFQPLTMNFEPYHHKPPFMFWLINLSWSVFGVSRWAGLIPMALASACCVFLTGALGRLLFPAVFRDGQRPALIMAASVPFLIYSTLVMFDLTLTVFVLSSLILTLLYARERRVLRIVLIGALLGLGVLTKGPVAYLYVLPPLLLAPLWVKDFQNPAPWYGACALALLLSVLPVLLWLVPVLKETDGDFAFWLVWNQTAGRITGNFSDAHNRPFYFYLPLLPVMAMPWIFFPSFWRGAAAFVKKHAPEMQGVRFLLCWLVPVFLCFCFISGKQPHYLLPLLPGIVLLTGLFLQPLRTKTLAVTLAAMIALIFGGQAVASQTFFKSYDLEPLTAYIQSHPDRDWAYVRNYHAEFGFLARLKKPVADLQLKDLPAWFDTHPSGVAVIRYKNPKEVAAYDMVLNLPYRGKRLGVFLQPQR